MDKSDPIAARVCALEDERMRATIAGDLATLDRLMHDELVYAHSNGIVDSKSEYLAKLRNGSLRYQAMNLLKRNARRFGDTVITNGRLRVEVDADGKHNAFELLYTCVYSTAAESRLLSWHATRAPA